MNKASVRQITEIEDLNQLEDDFLSTISHELRSLLSNIKVATQMLKLLLQQDENNENDNTQFLTRLSKQHLKQKLTAIS